MSLTTYAGVVAGVGHGPEVPAGLLARMCSIRVIRTSLAELG